MADVVRTTRKQSLQMAGVIAGSVLTFNALFWLMSSMYYDDKPQQATNIDSVRIAFATLSFIVAGMAYAASLAPRLIGHGIAVVVGIASIVGGVAALTTTMPGVVGATLLVVGLTMPVLTWLSLSHSRSAWAFLIALLAVLGTVTFFGAPKVRHVLDIGLWHALIIPGVQIVGVIALSMLRGEYRDQG